jgi:malate/lactate dehydrogenase
MQTTNAYEQLIAEITDEDEKKVFDVLLQADGRRVTRVELAREVYGVVIEPAALANSVEDRKVREIIHRLRKRDYPIVSSSGEAGYTMKASAEEMDTYIADQASRKAKIQENIDAAYRSKEKARLVGQVRNEFRTALPAPVQMSFIPRQERFS